MRIFLKVAATQLLVSLMVSICSLSFAQNTLFEFGTQRGLNNITSGLPEQQTPIKWMNVNTTGSTWSKKEGGILVCSGHPIGVIRTEKQYENFMLHIEWKHMEAGGNSGVF